MKVVIVRLFEPVGTGDGRLRGTVELPGHEPRVFAGPGGLLDAVLAVAGREGTAAAPGDGPPGRRSALDRDDG